MSLLVDLDIDADLLAALDFKPALPCEVRMALVGSSRWFGRPIVIDPGQPCTLEAAWVARCRACGHAPLCCEEHRQEILALTAPMLCRCGAEAKAAELLEFLPLGVQS